MRKFNSASLNVHKVCYHFLVILVWLTILILAQNTERIVLFGGKKAQLTRVRGWFSNYGLFQYCDWFNTARVPSSEPISCIQHYHVTQTHHQSDVNQQYHLLCLFHACEHQLNLLPWTFSWLAIEITISLIIIGLKKLLFFTNSLVKLLSDSMLLGSLLSDSSISQSHSRLHVVEISQTHSKV